MRGPVVALAALALIAAATYYAVTVQRLDEGGEGDMAPDLIDYAAQVADTVGGEYEENSDMNTKAFLMALRVGEGAADANGYRRLCGGGNFDNFAKHPALAGWRGLPLSDALCDGAGVPRGSVSTAAGAYQINKPTWLRLAAKLGLTDFSPASQDAAAMQLIAEKGATADVSAGRTASAVYKIRRIWASLPGAGYGQRQVSQDSFDNEYMSAGGVLA